MISNNLKEIKKRIPEGVRLIAVSKGQSIEKIRNAIEAGQKDFGENYAQELLEHSSQLSAVGGQPLAVHWHFIGRLQRNKVKQVIGKVSLIHSVDSLDLAREIDRRAAALGKIQPILMEINLAGETYKTGVQPSDVEKLVSEMLSLKNLKLEGLMVLPPYHHDPEQIRPYFRRLREIRDAINLKNLYKHPLTELSMGMTHDFEVAIEEGATIVRIGTGIFGERT